MNTHADKTDENKTASIESKPGQQRKDKQPSLQIIDNRPETIALRKLQEMADNSPQVKQMAQLQAMANKHVASQPSINPKKENETGLPDNLKSGIENLSGYAMDAVKVHYNSSKPAQLNTHASAQGNDIHLASGQEKHLPHEAWHVEQQKQGRVNATFQMKEKVNINDNVNLEKEADLVGNKIPGRSNMGPHERLPEPEAIPSNQSFFVSKTIQAKWIFKNGLRVWVNDDYELQKGESLERPEGNPEEENIRGSIDNEEVHEALNNVESTEHHEAIKVLIDDDKHISGLKKNICPSLIKEIAVDKIKMSENKALRIIQLCDLVGKYDFTLDDGRNLLHLFVGYSGDFYYGICKLLIDNKVDVNKKGGDKENSPLHLAVSRPRRDEKLCKLLIDNGAEVHAKNKYGQTMIAMESRKNKQSPPDKFESYLNKLGEDSAEQIKNVDSEDVFCSMIYIQKGGTGDKELPGIFKEHKKNKLICPLIKAIESLEDSGFKIIGSSGSGISNVVVTVLGKGDAEGFTPSGKNNKKIYFSAGGKKTAKNKSGTILHEATHHMMNLIFGNQESDNPSAPFSCDKEGGDKKKEFMGIVNTVQEKVKKMKEKEKDKNKCPILESICKAFEYEDILWAGELIVKVPEIIAEFGEEWLENNVPELIAYWKNEIVPKLNDFKPDK